MSGPFKVGDVVCCIDDSRDIRGNSPFRGAHPKRGGLYRVASSLMSNVGVAGITLREFPEAAKQGLWAADRFRHLPKADEQFTAHMRALKPTKVDA